MTTALACHVGDEDLANTLCRQLEMLGVDADKTLEAVSAGNTAEAEWVPAFTRADTFTAHLAFVTDSAWERRYAAMAMHTVHWAPFARERRVLD